MSMHQCIWSTELNKLFVTLVMQIAPKILPASPQTYPLKWGLLFCSDCLSQGCSEQRPLFRQGKRRCVCVCFTTEVFALELGRSCVSPVVIRCVKLLVENRAVVSVISEEWMVLGFRATISVFLEIYGWVGVIGYDSIFCPPSKE